MNALSARRSPRLEEPKAVICAHCGAAVPETLLKSAGGEPSFCCRGCHTAYELIHTHGLQDFYLRNQPGGLAPGNDSLLSRYADYDQPEFEALYVRQDVPGTKQVCLALSGIHCAACIWLLEKLPRIQPGVISASVHWSRGTIDLRWASGETRLSEVAWLLNRLGYPPQPVRIEALRRGAVLENRRQLKNLGIAAALAGNNMLIGAALYFGLLSNLGDSIEWLLRSASGLLGLLAVLIPGRVFFRSAWSALRTRTPHVDIPVTLGLSVGTASGWMNLFSGTGEIYFDSISSLVALLLIGRYLQFRQQRQTADAVDLLYRLTPRTARKIVEQRVVETLVDLLRVGDEIEILPGQTVPGDGTILEGESALDEALLTGEARPATRGPGDRVFAGTHNLQSRLRVGMENLGRESRMGRLLEMMETETRRRGPMLEWANRAGGWFVYAVLSVAVLTFVCWAPSSISTALANMVAVLIVACPCVIALAAPVALALTISRAAGRGILIKNGDVLQRLAEPGELWLDKTGTLTEGRMRLVEWLGDRRVALAVAALERQSSHSLAAAFDADSIAAIRGEAVENWPRVDHCHSDSRGGIVGQVEGQALAIGNRSLMVALGIAIPDSAAHLVEEYSRKGLTAVLVSADGQVVAVAGVGDRLRPDAFEAIQRIRKQGWEVGILSGDHPQTVRAVAAELGIDLARVRGGVTPEEKLRWIREGEGSETGTTSRSSLSPARVMVGDGINDSAALAAAAVGIAMQGGAEASLSAAGVYLNRGGLNALAELLSASRQTMRTIRASLSVSLLYNTFSVGLAAAGWIHPLIAALMMPLSSLTVILLAWCNPAFQTYHSTMRRL